MTTLTLIRPDDFHLHLRDGAELVSVVRHSADRFARAVIMPNLQPPVVTVRQALDYRNRILSCLGEAGNFNPLMALYLTADTSREEITLAAASEHVLGVKLYPAGATTHSERGVTSIESVYPVLEAMAEVDLPLLVHGEATDPEIDVFDRETAFIDAVLEPLLRRFPTLRVVFEHISTLQALEFVRSGPDTLAATITPQHLMYNRNALFAGGLQPHLYCLPVLKRERHRRALMEAVAAGHPRLFAGTDSAPHGRSAKEHDCGCAGIYSACGALEFYAELLDDAGALDCLEQFTSINGARFYRLPPNSGTITLERADWRVPESLAFGDDSVVPLRAGQTCRWRLAQS